MSASLRHGWGYALKRPHLDLVPLIFSKVALSPAPGCDITVYYPGTTTAVTLYSDDAGTQPLANPFVSDQYAFFSFYCNVPAVDVRISGVGIDIPYTIGNFIFEPGSTQYYNVKAYGLKGDGTTDDRAALTTLANTTIGSCGGTLYFPSGNYRIAGDIQLPEKAVLLFDKCAILVPDAGVTIRILGPVDARPFQIFNTQSGGVVDFQDVGRTIRSATPHSYPDWWGCNGQNSPYDTHGVQEAINACLTVQFARPYYVTSVLWQTAAGRCGMIDGNNWFLIGIANSSTEAIFQFDNSFATIRDLWVDAQFNANYACAFQIKQTLAQAGPLFNQFVGLKVVHSIIGIVIGTPPSGPFSGPAPYGTSGDCFTDLFVNDCQICIYCNLPNAKFTFTNARLLVSGIAWNVANPGVFSYPNSYVVQNIPNNGLAPPNDLGGGELAFYGGELYNAEAGAEVGHGISGANIVVDGAIWEMAGSNIIDADVGTIFSRITLRNLLDAGNGNGAIDAFVTTINAKGQALFDNCNWNLAATLAQSAVGNFFNGANSPNFAVIFANSEIVEWPWTYVTTGAVLGTLVKGCRGVFRDCRYFTLSPGFEGRVNTNEGAPIFDTADGLASSMSTVFNQTTKNGWAWGGDGNAADNFAGESGDLPAFDAYTAAIQLVSVGGGTANIFSPTGTSGFKVPVFQNMGMLVFRACIKTNNLGTASIFVNFYKWNGSASATAPVHLFGDDLTVLNFTSWQRLTAKVPVPPDATFGAIVLQTTNGGVMRITAISL